MQKRIFSLNSESGGPVLLHEIHPVTHGAVGLPYLRPLLRDFSVRDTGAREPQLDDVAEVEKWLKALRFGLGYAIRVDLRLYM